MTAYVTEAQLTAIGTLIGDRIKAKVDAGVGGGNAGSTEIDLGVWPGVRSVDLVIEGQANIAAGSKVEAWIVAKDTADHSADEHLIGAPFLVCGAIIPGVGFTISARSSWPRAAGKFLKYGRTEMQKPIPKTYGRWAIAWRWQ